MQRGDRAISHSNFFLLVMVIVCIGAIGLPSLPSITLGDDVENVSAGVQEGVNDSAAAAEEAIEDEPINETQIELEVHKGINEERSKQGLSMLEYDHELAEVSQYHSDQMVAKDFFAHESPSGRRVADRYEMHGYNCSVDMGGPMVNRGGENIAYTFAYGDVDTSEGIENYAGNETKIAEALVQGWMNSEGHRENLLKPYWNAEGIGVNVTEESGETVVYATQNFC